jgi:hypothetical protein
MILLSLFTINAARRRCLTPDYIGRRLPTQWRHHGRQRQSCFEATWTVATPSNERGTQYKSWGPFSYSFYRKVLLKTLSPPAHRLRTTKHKHYYLQSPLQTHPMSLYLPHSRRRRAVSPAYYPSCDTLDLFRNYTSYDTILPGYGYNFGLGYGSIGQDMPATKAIEMAARAHTLAQKELEKAKEKFEEAKKAMEEMEEKVKQAEEMLQAAKWSSLYAA